MMSVPDGDAMTSRPPRRERSPPALHWQALAPPEAKLPLLCSYFGPPQECRTMALRDSAQLYADESMPGYGLLSALCQRRILLRVLVVCPCYRVTDRCAILVEVTSS